MRWTVRLEARTDTGEVETTELVTIGRPVVGGTLAELGLALSEAKSVLAKLQASMVQSQVADYAACHRAAAIAVCRVGGDVAAPTPHRPGRADFPHPVPRGRVSLGTVYCRMILVGGRGWRRSSSRRRSQ